MNKWKVQLQFFWLFFIMVDLMQFIYHLDSYNYSDALSAFIGMCFGGTALFYLNWKIIIISYYFEHGRLIDSEWREV